MEGVVVPPAPARGAVGARVGRYRGAIELVAATVVGLVLLPVVFRALSAHDLLIGETISAVSLTWLILALVDSGVALHARSAVAADLADASGRLLATLPRAEGVASGEAADAPALGSRTARGLLDLVLLLIVQATLRVPLVAVASTQAPPAIVDGAYVVVVVLLALIMLIRLRGLAAPLAERVAWIGINQLVPTAGFATTTSAAAAFTTRLATTTGARATTATPVSAPRPSIASPPPVRAETAAPTVLAEPAPVAGEATIAAVPTIVAPAPSASEVVAEATVLATPTPPSATPEATVVEPSLTVVEAPADSAKVTPPAPSDATIVQPAPKAKTEAEETLVEEAPVDATPVQPSPPASPPEDRRN